MTVTAFQGGAFQRNAFQFENNSGEGGGGGGLSPYMVAAYKAKFREKAENYKKLYEETLKEVDGVEKVKLEKIVEPFVINSMLDLLSFDILAANDLAVTKLMRVVDRVEKTKQVKSDNINKIILMLVLDQI